MKKWIALCLALVMALSMAACGSKNKAEVPGSALEILDNIWALFGSSEKFPASGGDFENNVDGKPGVFSLDDPEALTFPLLVPQEQTGNVDDAAALIHSMMLNNFTGASFHIKGDAKDFAGAMADSIRNNHWMCGMPDTMVVAVIGGEYVVMAFGVSGAMDPFIAHLTEAYPDAEIVAQEPVV